MMALWVYMIECNSNGKWADGCNSSELHITYLCRERCIQKINRSVLSTVQHSIILLLLWLWDVGRHRQDQCSHCYQPPFCKAGLLWSCLWYCFQSPVVLFSIALWEVTKQMAPFQHKYVATLYIQINVAHFFLGHGTYRGAAIIMLKIMLASKPLFS